MYNLCTDIIEKSVKTCAGTPLTLPCIGISAGAFLSSPEK